MERYRQSLVFGQKNLPGADVAFSGFSANMRQVSGEDSRSEERLWHLVIMRASRSLDTLYCRNTTV